MAVLTVPRPLQERLGDAATEALIGMLRQMEVDQDEHRTAQKEHLFELLEERFLRHVVESEERLRKELRAEMNAGFTRLQEQISGHKEQITGLGTEIGGLRVEIGEVRAEIASVLPALATERAALLHQIGEVRAEIHREIANVQKEIAVRTRWILAVVLGAAVLFPIIQRVMETLLP